ncbi:MAG: hypothetical protein I3273_03870 [Candidatus Moeniiplasma glomeromycotorum]|nr:hypothetical protein [Candidatus Moeniiplasma glomeromycotorum]
MDILKKKKKNNNGMMPNTSLKKTWVYIGVGLAVFILIAVGGLLLWKNWKSSPKSDSDDKEAEDINPEEIPPEIISHRKKDWTNSKTGLWEYKIPKNLPTNISVSRAKDELLEALWQWWGKDKTWDKKKIARTLEKNAQRIDLADKKGNENDPLFNTKFLESIAEKYQPKNIFSNLPPQNKFRESLSEIKGNIHFLRVSFDLKYKSHKKIDWLASLQTKIKGRIDNRTKTQKEADFAKMTNYLEREYNPFIRRHLNQFPFLNNLKELNQWVHTLTKKEAVANKIIFARFYLGWNMKKKVISPAQGGIEKRSFGDLKNEKFGLEPIALNFKL